VIPEEYVLLPVVIAGLQPLRPSEVNCESSRARPGRVRADVAMHELPGQHAETSLMLDQEAMAVPAGPAASP